MTTTKPYHGRDSTVAFKKPTVGARVYIVESMTGWPETHNRKAADEAIAKFLAPLSVDEVLRAFQTAIELETWAENWDGVLGFLGEITDHPTALIPDIVGVGFWGQLTMLEHQRGAN
jgi:hypothetical protein